MVLGLLSNADPITEILNSSVSNSKNSMKYDLFTTNPERMTSSCIYAYQHSGQRAKAKSSHKAPERNSEEKLTPGSPQSSSSDKNQHCILMRV